MTKPARVLLGEITRPHGVRGEVMVRSFCADPQDIAAYGPLTNETGTRRFNLTIRGATTKGLIGHIAGVTDRTAAEALRGVGLYLARELLPEPDDDEVYHADLIDMRVFNTDGTDLGTVLAVQNFGAGDLLEVRQTGSRDTEFYPFTERFVTGVDLDNRTITLTIESGEETSADDSQQGTAPERVRPRQEQ